MQTRGQWLKQRREIITASDWYPILFGSALSVYEKKVHGYNLEDNDQFLFGRLVEGPIAEVYAKKTGRHVEDLGATEIQVSKDIPWLGATLDRWQTVEEQVGESEDGEVITDTWSGPLECKSASGKKASEWTNTDAPIENMVQLQAQLYCTDSLRGTLCGLLWGNQWMWHDKELNQPFIDVALPILDAFRLRVKRHDPPPAISDTCLPVLKRIYSDESGETVPLDSSVQVSVELLEQAKKRKSAADREVKMYEAEIRAAIGHATWGALPDGRFIALKTTHRKGYTVEPTSYRQLSIKVTR